MLRSFAQRTHRPQLRLSVGCRVRLVQSTAVSSLPPILALAWTRFSIARERLNLLHLLQFVPLRSCVIQLSFTSASPLHGQRNSPLLCSLVPYLLLTLLTCRHGHLLRPSCARHTRVAWSGASFSGARAGKPRTLVGVDSLLFFMSYDLYMYVTGKCPKHIGECRPPPTPPSHDTRFLHPATPAYRSICTTKKARN